jgi:hypothetical protein
MLIQSRGTFGKLLCNTTANKKEDFKDIRIVSDKDEALGVFVPYEIWYQVQHFISRIIERDNA